MHSLRLSKVEIDKFWKKVLRGGGCWRWLGMKSRGYGIFPVKRRGKWLQVRAHRVAYLLEKETPGACLDHLCFHKWCVKPAHLEDVTAGENAKRWFAAQKFCRNGHRWTEGNTILFHKKGQGVTRWCRLCKNMANNRYWHRKGRFARAAARMASKSL